MKKLTEKEKIAKIMKEEGVDEGNAGKMLAVEEGFTDGDGTKFTYDEGKGCFVGTTPDGKNVCCNI